jgi:hypothetical protein
MRIEARITDVKRHTKGYVVSGKPYTRHQAVVLARQNKINNVRVVNSGATRNGRHLVGVGINLYDLPIRLESEIKPARRSR